MKTGQLFWGAFFLSIGILFFAVQQDLITTSWGFVWKLWPLLFILWGISIIVKNSSVKPIFSVIGGLVLALLIFGSVASITKGNYWFEYNENNFEYNGDDNSYDSKDFSVSKDTSVTHAYFELNGGAGKIKLNSLNDNNILIKGKVNTTNEYYTLDSQFNNQDAKIVLKTDNIHIDPFQDRKGSLIDFELNSDVIWDLTVNVGAAKTELDLSDISLRSLELNCGASKQEIKLGNKLTEVNMDISIGAASVELKIPEGAGFKISGETFMVTKDISDFTEDNFGNLISRNFDNAKVKFFIKLDGGVSSFEINYY